MIEPGEDKKPPEARVVEVAPGETEDTRADIERLNRRLSEMEHGQRGETVRLVSMFLLGTSVGICLALLYLEVMRNLMR